MNSFKHTYIYMVALLALALTTACSGGKHLSTTPTPMAQASQEKNQELLLRVVGTASKAKAVSAKANIKLSADGKKLSVPGTLRMKKGEVVRLQLTALGIMEAGRVEFTPDYVLIIDRLNKRYAKARYADIDFLRDNGITFASLQALFWGELFSPGADQMTQDDLMRFGVKTEGTGATVTTKQGKLNYQWQVNSQSGRIARTKVGASGVSLSCAYEGTTQLSGRPFPGAINLAFTMPGRTFGMNINLTEVDADGQWDTLTTLSDRYKAVNAEDIMKILMNLAK